MCLLEAMVRHRKRTSKTDQKSETCQHSFLLEELSLILSNFFFFLLKHMVTFLKEAIKVLISHDLSKPHMNVVVFLTNER